MGWYGGVTVLESRLKSSSFVSNFTKSRQLLQRLLLTWSETLLLSSDDLCSL